MPMLVFDVNTSFGKRVADDPRFSADSLVGELDRHRVAGALTFSRKGLEYDFCAGNDETLMACRAHPGLWPVATLDPRDSLTWQSDLDLCLRNGFKAIRFFPGDQRWSTKSALFRQILRKLAGSGICLIFSSLDCLTGWEAPDAIASATAALALPVLYTDTYYANMAEMMAVLQEYPHVYVETHWLATVRAVEVMVEAAGPGRVLYGSNAPLRPMQKALNQVLEADIPSAHKEAILGANALRLFNISPDELSGRPQLASLEPAVFDKSAIDVHSHLGYWRAPIPHEEYDPGPMLRRMDRFGITHSIVSSYESMRYDVASGNRRIGDAIAGHPELYGYVELNPYDIAQACREMDRYYATGKFIGAEVELTHIPCSTGSERVRALFAEIARRGRPVLFMPASANDAQAERDLARQHPNLTIIHAHGFTPDWARVVADTPNICVEFCLSCPSHHDLRECIDILGPERVLFGTDQTLLSVGAAVGLYLDACMTPREQELVLHANAKRIFRLGQA